LPGIGLPPCLVTPLGGRLLMASWVLLDMTLVKKKAV
jgi:uncharacterized membrane protein YgdD (TMEM256/DUF423 family)